ncbi:MAG: helix-turn-helix transcriptional regulator [Mycobacterium sp.]|nr:helix-turn-helix transcriptional regulator [Mycobacterium sp.]
MESLCAASEPLTATQLSDLVGESPANCSWHLRELARHDFVEEAGGGKGRRRPWRPVLRNLTWGDPAESSEAAVAGAELSRTLQDQTTAALSEWLVSRQREPSEWQEAAFAMHSMVWLTPAELTALARDISRSQLTHAARNDDPKQRPADARLVRLVCYAIPIRTPDQAQ